MLVPVPAFSVQTSGTYGNYPETPSDTCQKIIKWEKYFNIPTDAKLSPVAQNFIKSLVSTCDKRLGNHGVEEIKKHQFFKNFDWKNISKMKAPFIPDIVNDWDTKYFDKFEETEPFYPEKSTGKVKHRKVSIILSISKFNSLTLLNVRLIALISSCLLP